MTSLSELNIIKYNRKQLKYDLLKVESPKRAYL